MPSSLATRPLQASSTPSSYFVPTWVMDVKQILCSELWEQGPIALPLIGMNLTWFAKTAITTAFLGRLGDLQLAGGTLGFTFANVTGFSVLNGLCGAMEPICGQAFGAKNYKLLHKTLLMTTILLLVASLPISFLWLNVDKILNCFGMKEDIMRLAKQYITFLLPDLVVTSFLCPLKAYLSTQGITLPTLFSSAVALAFHVPLNILLVRAKGIDGVAMAIWITDLIIVIILAAYVLVTEKKCDSAKSELEYNGGWWEQRLSDWVQLLQLSAPCCLTTCLEWWCYEIMVLLAGRLPNARQSVSVLAVVLNFDYLLYSVMLSLATSASVRISNGLGASQATAARNSAFVSLVMAIFSGLIGGMVMAMARGQWGKLFTHDKGILKETKRMMLLMAVLELVNFPLAVCGGVVRGTARPWLGMFASVGGFYLVALPVAVVLAFRLKFGLAGLLFGLLAGTATSLSLLVVFVLLINWEVEAVKAKKLAGVATDQPENESKDRRTETSEVGSRTIEL